MFLASSPRESCWGKRSAELAHGIGRSRWRGRLILTTETLGWTGGVLGTSLLSPTCIPYGVTSSSSTAKSGIKPAVFGCTLILFRERC
ncbi:hypothetical protein BDV37DRAFT_239147 [Aspergillus pseudonomiae]|uniref:Uncharacterized protein n=1 Tax=Aspergillus pseudonomiae TaxID=1506151 RepID=A0A5N7DQB4_9EURO|nr:uncharacterized protein BDV37DRAFT_239147 [Aspergillus pseudonomiae]KAE8408239.1 hypothetical protein BDV37DRAFT_239147 [Aspergillus pseudonomiae]